MNSFTYLALFTAMSIGLVSYVVCLYLARSEGNVGIGDFLMIGNHPTHAAVSIVGTIFSGSALFTGMIHFYRVYGWFLFPVYFLSAIMGMWLLAARIRALLDGNSPSHSSKITPSHVWHRYSRLSEDSGNRFALYSITNLYIVVALITEISIFRGALLAFGEDVMIPFATLILIAITYAYVYLGGFRGVLLTDMTQMVTILFAFGVLFAVLIGNPETVKDFSLPVVSEIRQVDVVCTGIAAMLVGIGIWSSAPEIWIRVATLGQVTEAHTAIRWALLGSSLVLLLPVLLVGYAAPDPAASIKLTEAFTVWSSVLNGNVRVLSFAFLVILVNAIFTTIDTLMLTFEQLLWIMREEFALIKSGLAGRLRMTTPLMIAVCFAAAMRLSDYVLFLVGALSISLPIVLFAIIHVAPRLGVRSISVWTYWCPVIAGIVVMPLTYQLIVAGRPAYYLVMLAIAGTQALTLIVLMIWKTMKTVFPSESDE